MTNWIVDSIIHFGPEDLVKDGLAHFGFHDRTGNSYAISHQKHFLGIIGEKGKLKWTAGANQVFEHVPNITAKLSFRCISTTFRMGH